MEALKILKRIAFYLLFIVASTLCFYSLVSLSLTAYTEAWGNLDFDLVAKEVFLPLLYAFLSLGLALIAQIFLIGKPKQVETTLYPWLLIGLFGIGAVVSLIILGYGLFKLESEPLNQDPIFLIVPLVVALLFTLSEILYGALILLRQKKECKILEQKESEAKAAKEAEGVNLHKEE